MAGSTTTQLLYDGLDIIAEEPEPHNFRPFLPFLTKEPHTELLIGELIGDFPDYKKRELYWRDNHTLVFEYCNAEIKGFRNKVYLAKGGKKQTYEIILLRNCNETMTP